MDKPLRIDSLVTPCSCRFWRERLDSTVLQSFHCALTWDTYSGSFFICNASKHSISGCVLAPSTPHPWTCCQQSACRLQSEILGGDVIPSCPLLLLVTSSTLFCPSIASRFCSSLFSSRSSSRLKEKYGVVANSPISSSKEGPSCGLSRHRISGTKSQNFWRKNFHYYYWKMGVAHCSVEYYIIVCW